MIKRRGFTLVEVMIVVAIIALLAAISIPNLMRARLNANEAAAIAAVKTLSTAQQTFKAVNNGFASLTTLRDAVPPYIDSVLGGGSKQGYTFNVSNADQNQFVVIAFPASANKTGVRSFCTTEDGVIKFNNTAFTLTTTTCSGTPIE